MMMEASLQTSSNPTNLQFPLNNVDVHGYPGWSASIATKQYKEVDRKKIDVDVQDLDMHVVGTMMLHVGRE